MPEPISSTSFPRRSGKYDRISGASSVSISAAFESSIIPSTVSGLSDQKPAIVSCRASSVAATGASPFVPWFPPLVPWFPPFLTWFPPFVPLCPPFVMWFPPAIGKKHWPLKKEFYCLKEIHHLSRCPSNPSRPNRKRSSLLTIFGVFCERTRIFRHSFLRIFQNTVEEKFTKIFELRVGKFCPRKGKELSRWLLSCLRPGKSRPNRGWNHRLLSPIDGLKAVCLRPRSQASFLSHTSIFVFCTVIWPEGAWYVSIK